MEYFHLKANIAETLLQSEDQLHLLFLPSTEKLVFWICVIVLQRG